MNHYICLLFALCFSVGFAQNIELHEMQNRVWRAVSYSDYQGKSYPSNSLIIEQNDSLILIDTAWGNDNTLSLLDKIKTQIKKPIAGAIITHWHEDKAGGVAALQKEGIPTFGYYKTWAKLVKEKRIELDSVLYKNTSKLQLAGLELWVYYPGKGHTDDNTLVFLPEQNMLYGGCFLKDKQASDLGNLADADPKQWRRSLKKTLLRFRTPIRRKMQMIPGHGEPSRDLIFHTLELTKKNLDAQKSKA